ncbi:MAG: hypothetical protein KAQ98_00415 [Bacteriovoracaceae bacterium]|nr:hypothetical protein [Bacteriovoracaceae bacterium]
MGLLLRFLQEEDGQTSTEYILLLAVVALIVFKFKEVAMEKLTKLTEGVFGNAENMVNELSQQ